MINLAPAAVKLKMENAAKIPGLGERLSLILLVCGIGLVFLGISSGLKGDEGLLHPAPEHLQSYTGKLQDLTFISPHKAPSVVDLVLFRKGNSPKRGYLNYGLHSWEERLKPFKNKEITILVAADHQIWGIEAAGRVILSSTEIEQTFLKFKKGQEIFAIKMDYVGFGLILFWLLFLRKR